MSTPVRFSIRWREELVGTMDEHQFVVEITMGKLVVYFPEEKGWEASAPAWAKGQWGRVHADLEAWCAQEKIPLRVEGNAWVQFC